MNTEYIIKVVTSHQDDVVDVGIVTACHGLMGICRERGLLTEIVATAIVPVGETGVSQRVNLFDKENGAEVVYDLLRLQHARVLKAAAAALERVQVATDPSGAADEAVALLEQVVTLDGSYVEPQAPRGVQR